jgi:molecular chaperone GrpE
MQSSPESDAQDQRGSHTGGPVTTAEEAPAPPAGTGRPAAGGQAPAGDGVALAQMEDRYKRALADLDNYRKRSARDVQMRVAESREALLRDWLEVVDSVERALQMSHATPAADGLRALLEQMEATLARHGAQRIAAAGEPFDPERHEAIDVRTSTELPDRAVLEVARSGWAIGDRVLRPALVVVARRPDPV